MSISGRVAGALSIVSAISLIVAPSAFGQLEASVDAHGGLPAWRSFAGVEFDHTWTSAKGVKKEHQLFDLQSRDGLITSDKYTLGAKSGEVWIKPALDALGGMPPRFYMWTPFYFFGMPFVFADPGAIQEPLGKKTLGGQEYDAVKVTFKKGTGDTPDDFYIAYLEPHSQQLKVVNYVVTFPALRKGKPIEELELNAILFDEWQEVGKLRVPKRASFYDWKDGNIVGQPAAVMEFSNVRFFEKPPDPATFNKPADAISAPLK